jgi:hypothetical protein
VELSTRLSEQLSLLATGSVHDGSGVVGDLTALAATLTEAVSGYAGLRLTLVQGGHPVQLTALLPEAGDATIVTSLRVPLPAVAGSAEQGGELVVWSSVPGSLVDLAADLGYVLAGPARATDHPVSTVVALDTDLPRPGAGSGVRGLEELATVNRAVGVLIGQGHDPASVQDVLRRRAADEGLSPYAWADKLLKEQALRPTEGGAGCRPPEVP